MPYKLGASKILYLFKIHYGKRTNVALIDSKIMQYQGSGQLYGAKATPTFVFVYKQSRKRTLYLVTTVWKSCSAAVLLFIHTKSFLAFYLNT